jgi:hypothetical protein
MRARVEEEQPITDKWAEIQKITKERLEHIEKKTRASIEEVDENLEPNPWLRRVGWVRHLTGKDPERLRAAVEPSLSRPSIIEDVSLLSSHMLVYSAREEECNL